MDRSFREDLAERLLECGALAVMPGEAVPLRWAGEKALEDPALRELVTRELEALVREHYAAAEAVMGDVWSRALEKDLGLPAAGEPLKGATLLVLGSTGDIPAYLPALTALRSRGGSPAIAVIWNGREDELRLRLDRADIRCHWLTDLELGASAALRRGLLDFEDYCRLIPQD